MTTRSTTTLIRNLQLSLPAVFTQRAENIARETARCLAALPLQVSLRVSALDVAPVRVSPAESNRVIAQRLARAIMMQIELSGNRRDGHVG